MDLCGKSGHSGTPHVDHVDASRLGRVRGIRRLALSVYALVRTLFLWIERNLERTLGLFGHGQILSARPRITGRHVDFDRGGSVLCGHLFVLSRVHVVEDDVVVWQGCFVFGAFGRRCAATSWERVGVVGLLFIQCSFGIVAVVLGIPDCRRTIQTSLGNEFDGIVGLKQEEESKDERTKDCANTADKKAAGLTTTVW